MWLKLSELIQGRFESAINNKDHDHTIRNQFTYSVTLNCQLSEVFVAKSLCPPLLGSFDGEHNLYHNTNMDT